MLSCPPLRGPGLIPDDLRVDLIRIRCVISKRGAQLRLGEPVVSPPESAEAPLKALVGPDDFPDIDSGPRDPRPAPGGAVGKEDSRTPPEANGLGEQLVGQRGELSSAGLSRFLDRLGDFGWDP